MSNYFFSLSPIVPMPPDSQTECFLLIPLPAFVLRVLGSLGQKAQVGRCHESWPLEGPAGMSFVSFQI